MSIRESDGGATSPAPDPWPERARVEGRRVRTAFRVRYAETDKMGVAYYANYLVWFEVLRGDFMRALDVPYTRLEEEGIFLPIAEANLRYRAPARYDDVVELVGWLTEVRSRSVSFGYRVERGGELLATGSTRHVPVTAEGRPRQFPRELLERLAVLVDNEGEPDR